ncbi:LacI family DNA-binding transcriptional regulator [uncultured Cellulomonas sp.]|uniref:LacI family DNA-binding transcriptional regulator n=1 Tax=uncultured Cellulomonas sp. TaxID=189682 RepID=UPI00262AD3B4|nr:LacI family DNA-binding transcriptional regulator [uncultured Cellulomonas sp.]
MGRTLPTQTEVAARAGVSAATVSKVLNGHKDVAAATRARVYQAIESMGYRSPSARAHAAQLPQVLAFADGIATAYTATLLDGVISAGQSLGVDIVVRFGARPAAGDPATSRTLPLGCIGIVAITYGMRSVDGLEAPANLPVVVIDPSTTQPEHWMTIASTNWAGAKAATEHLIDLGHRRIGWLGGPTESVASSDRLHGYRAALQSAGLPLDEEIEVNGDFSVDFGRTAARSLLSREPRPSALVAANDEIAIGAIEAARSMGLGIPDDVSVVGYDGIPQASWSTPRLTTVQQPLTDMGRMAVRMIVDSARGVPPESRNIQLVTRLLQQESTSAPRVTAGA